MCKKKKKKLFVSRITQYVKPIMHTTNPTALQKQATSHKVLVEAPNASHLYKGRIVVIAIRILSHKAGLWGAAGGLDWQKDSPHQLRIFQSISNN